MPDAKDDVETFDRRARCAHVLAQPAAQPVAVDGARHRLAPDDIADAAGILRGGRGDQLQEMRVVANAELENRFERARAAQPVSASCHRVRGWRRRASDGQARAALGAASRQNLAAADGLHPGAKSVRARAAELEGW